MGLLDILSNLSQGFSEMTSKDEMVFGEIVRIFDKRGCPCIEFQAQSGYQSGRFLINGDVLFSVTVVLDKKVGKVSLVGVGMRSHAGVATKMFEALSNEGINIQMISTSEIKISVVIDEKYLELAVRALHSVFELDMPGVES